MSHVAFFGAGLLGAGFVQGFRQRGVAVKVWNRTRSRAEALVQFGAEVADSPAEAAAGAERVHLCLSDDAAVNAVLDACGDVLVGKPVIDHTTVLPAGVLARFAALEARGVPYLSAPVFMGPPNARDASGSMLVSGPKARFEAYEPWLTPMTGKVWYLGERVDQAAVQKLFGNAALISMVGVIGDIFQLARATGVPEQAALDTLAALNPALAVMTRGSRILKGQFDQPSFELAMARKDIRLMLETAGDLPLMVLPGLAAHMDRHVAAGESHLDFTVIARD